MSVTPTSAALPLKSDCGDTSDDVCTNEVAAATQSERMRDRVIPPAASGATPDSPKREKNLGDVLMGRFNVVDLGERNMGPVTDSAISHGLIYETW